MRVKVAWFAAALAMAFSTALPAQEQPAPADPPADAGNNAPAAPRFTLDTPLEVLAADDGAKAVLMADVPDLLPHPQYEMFKGMSLNQLQPMSQGHLTDEIMAKVAADLAALH